MLALLPDLGRRLQAIYIFEPHMNECSDNDIYTELLEG